ncbi:MAG: 5'-nucleotidase, lipoprotein e(P4) family [Vicingaceae bacterium]
MKNFGLLLLGSLFIHACSPSGKITENKSDQPTYNRHPDESAVLWQQTAAEYDALCYQAFNSALNWLDYNNDDYEVSKRPLTIVMDLDETVLDNSPYNAQLILDGKSYSQESWSDWTTRTEAKLVPGAAEFIASALNRGYQIYYISNRSADEADWTVRNLSIHGINVEYDHVLLDETGTGEKAERRQQVANSNEVIMFIGDNLADFGDFFEEEMTVTERKNLTSEYNKSFGSKFIVLPNPMYGKWDSTLKERDKEYPTNSQYNDRRSFLKGYKD